MPVENVKNFLVSDQSVERFIASEEYRIKLMDILVEEGRWADLSSLLCVVRHLGTPLWVDYFCAALDGVVFPEQFGEVETLLCQNGIEDYRALLALRRCRPGQRGAKTALKNALKLLREKRASDGYYYRAAVLADAFRLGLDPAPVLALMDIDAVEYLVARLAQPDAPRFAALLAALENWQQKITEDAPEIQRYLALRVSETLYLRQLTEGNCDGGQLVALYRRGMERRFDWEKEHRGDEMFSGEGEQALPATLKAMCAMILAFHQWEDEGDGMSALLSLRGALSLDITLDEVVKELTRQWSGRTEEQLQREQAQRQADAEQLEGMKKRIGMMIHLGCGADMTPFIQELERMYPADGDIRMLKVMAGLRKPN